VMVKDAFIYKVPPILCDYGEGCKIDQCVRCTAAIP